MIKDLPEKLKAIRIKYGYSQKQVADKANVSPSIISGYETGERTPSTDVLIQLADIFRVTTDYLLGIDHKKMIDVSDLSDEDIHFLFITIETLRKKNKN